MRLCLIRHGETVFNIDDRMQGVRDIELTPRGLHEAELLGHKLRKEGIHPTRICTSPVKRAYDTTIRLGYSQPIEKVEAFRSRSLGLLEGLTRKEINQRFPGAMENLILWDWKPPGGDEALGDIFRRADTEIKKTCEREKEPGLILIVTHSGVLEALVRGWFSIPPTSPLPFPLKNAGAYFFHGSPGNWIHERVIAAGDGDKTDMS